MGGPLEKKMRALFFLVALACSASGCAVPRFEVMPRYGRFSVAGEAAVNAGALSSGVDVEDAGLEEDEDSIHGRAGFKFGAPHFIVSGISPRFEGTGTLDAAVDDGTNTIPGGATVNTRLELGIYDGLVVFDFVPGDTLELALGVGGNVLDFELAFEEVGTGTEVATEETFVVPLLAALGAVQLGPLELQVLGAGFNASYQGDSIMYWSGDAFLRLKLLGGDEHVRVSLVGGYRINEFEIEYDDEDATVDVDLRLQGPYAGLDITL